MTESGQIPSIVQYITEHPGSYLKDILRDTKIPKCSATSALSKLIASRVLRREGFTKRYRYYAVSAEEAENNRKSSIAPSEVNPLTKLFNQRLALVRSGREI